MIGPFGRGENGAENSVEVSVEASVEVSVEAQKVGHGHANAGEGAGRRTCTPEAPEARLPKSASALRSRPRAAGDEFRSLTRHLTARDRSIVLTVARHRVFTTGQLTEMFFGHHKTAGKRLAYLVEARVLDRFQPQNPVWGGSRPYHYVLGPMGAAVAAAHRGEDPDRAARRWKGERTLALGRTQRLAHVVGVNGVYASLVGHIRRRPEAALPTWMTEAQAARWTEGIVRPDAFGRWQEGDEAVEFFLEYDRGTESRPRLVEKLADYERFESERGATAFVLFAFVSERRERTARAALTGATVPVATAALSDDSGPHAAVWLPLGGHGERLRLAALGRVPKPVEAQQRAAAGGRRAWLFEKRSRLDDDEEAPIDTP